MLQGGLRRLLEHLVDLALVLVLLLVSLFAYHHALDLLPLRLLVLLLTLLDLPLQAIIILP